MRVGKSEREENRTGHEHNDSVLKSPILFWSSTLETKDMPNANDPVQMLLTARQNAGLFYRVADSSVAFT